MDYRILGPLGVSDGDRPLTVRGTKQCALLAMLLLHANEVVASDRLIDELWAGEGNDEGSKALQMAVSRLRKVLEPDRVAGQAGGVVVTRPPGYQLRVEADELDLQRFEALVAEGREALAVGDPRHASVKLGNALRLWRGPPLADLADESFCRGEIARLEELRVAALEDRIAADLELGRHVEVVGELQELVAHESLQERPREQLMLALYRSGRRAEALDVYADTRGTFIDGLGIEPGRRLRDLHQAILQRDQGLDLVGTEPAAQALRSAFVGRGPELAELVGGLDEVFAGRGLLFLLVGEPGIGKSRLTEELIAHATVRGARVLVGRCWEAGGAPAYWPWVQSLRAHVRESDSGALRSELGTGAAELAQIVPELRALFTDLPQPPALESEGARFRLFDATAEFLRKASQDRPIVLVLDDLHAADVPSLLLLQFLARGLGSTRVLLLGAYRDVDPIPGAPLTEMLAEVSREPVTRHISLGGLSESEVAEYVELTASEIASPEVFAALHEEAEGNPLFVGELVRLISVEGLCSESAAEAPLPIPQSIRDVIARRLAHLSEECNRVLVLAAVIGREFTLGALARMGGVSEGELLDVLDEAMTARVVSDDPGGTGRLRFAHVLIRDTLHEGLTSARRVALHRRAAETLETLHSEEPGPFLAELAYHCIAGRDFDKGFRYAQRAGDRALALLAYEESARLYRTALEALARAGPSEARSRCELLLSLGEAEARAGDSPAAKEAFTEAAGIARRLGLSRELARAASGYGGRTVWARAGGDDQLVPLLEEGLAVVAGAEVELGVRLRARLAGALRDEHSRDRRDRLSREAVELARSTEQAAALAYALDGRAAAIVAIDTVAEGLALGSELCEVAERSGDTERVVSGHMWRIIAQLLVGDVRGAEVDLKPAMRIASELRQPAPLWEVCGARAMLALAAGRLSEAAEIGLHAFELGERAQPEEAASVYLLHRYTLCDFRGRLDEVEPAISDLAAEVPARPVFRCVLAHVHVRLGETVDSKRALDQLADADFSGLPFDQEWLYGMSLLAETAAVLGEHRSASVLYELLSPWAALNAVDVAEGFRGSVSRYLGILATTTGRWPEAERHFEDALAMNARMGARPWLAHTQGDYARMLLARDAPRDGERAKRLLSQARATYGELGMPAAAASASTPIVEIGR